MLIAQFGIIVVPFKFAYLRVLFFKKGIAIVNIIFYLSQSFRAYRPSAVILDIDLPELSGTEAARQIHTGLPDTPIVLIHEEESDEYRNSAIAAGAGGYVTKQKIAVELVPVLKKLLTTVSGKTGIKEAM